MAAEDTKNIQMNILKILQGDSVPAQIKNEARELANQFENATSHNANFNKELQILSLTELLLKVKNLAPSDKKQILGYIDALSEKLDASYTLMRNSIKNAAQKLQSEEEGPKPKI